MDQKPYTVSELANNSSFIRWARGNSDIEETRQWDRWIKADEKNRDLALKAQKIITGFSFEAPGLSHMEEDWSRVRDSITQKQSRTPSARRRIRKRTDVFALFVKVAALVLIISLAGLSLFMYQEQEVTEQGVAVQIIETAYGEKKTINLSDGSTIILAAGSQLSYKENWLSQPVKQLSLEGEAYFSIAPKESEGRPKFVVKTADGTVAVWGTQFTVAAYEEGTEVVLQAGEVRVGISGLNERREMTMEPGDRVRFQKSVQEFRHTRVNPRVYTSWTSNQLFFDDTPLSVLMNRIHRTYGVKVEVESPQLLDMELSGAVDFRSLDSLIAAVGEVLGISMIQSGDKIIIKKTQLITN